MSGARKSGFPGGIHPTDGYDKALTMELPVRPYQPKTVTILAEQSFGAKCRILVKKGDVVQKGQLIGEPDSFMAAPLHASVSGTVADVRQVDNRGKSTLAVIIRRDEGLAADAEKAADIRNGAAAAETAVGAYERKIVSIDAFTREKIIAGLKDGGLSGMGGAGFPTHKKYETPLPIDTLLINGAECEPFLTCDYRLMAEQGHAVLNGVNLLRKAAGAKQAYLCIEDNKPAAIEALTRLIDQEKALEGITVKALPTRYPQGGERQLIQSVLGREVPMGGLPADVGVIVSNVSTAKAAADMLLGGLPLTERIVTVTGSVEHPGNYLVPVGTSAKELVLFCGGVTKTENRVIAGGPMTGPCVAENWQGAEELFYITKNTSGILVLPAREYTETPCMRCGGCEQVCPAGLVPYQIDFAYLEEDFDLCESLYASECIACGCCSYICPAKRELTVRTAAARDVVKQKMRERAAKKK